MKLSPTKSLKRKSGMTLLELTVVILVLLSLISILFVGARAWKKGSDRAGCIINIRNTQQACRGFENMNPGVTYVAGDIFGSTAFLKFPKCPTAPGKASATALVGYTFAVPKAAGETDNVALTCTATSGDDLHKAEGTDQW